MWHFFSTLSWIVDFVDASVKCHFQLKSILEAEIIYLMASRTGTGVHQSSFLQWAGDTHWSLHFNSVGRLIDLFGSTCVLIGDIIDRGLNSNIHGEVKGL